MLTAVWTVHPFMNNWNADSKLLSAFKLIIKGHTVQTAVSIPIIHKGHTGQTAVSILQFIKGNLLHKHVKQL